MVNYSTDLKSWGSLGSEYPDSYSYVEGEQPVDEWDNFFNSRVHEDLTHLIDLTNSRIESEYGAAGSEPGTPEHPHAYYDTDNERLELWDDAQTKWYTHLRRDGDTMGGSLDMDGNEIVDGQGALTLSSAVDVTGNLTVDTAELQVTGGDLTLDSGQSIVTSGTLAMDTRVEILNDALEASVFENAQYIETVETHSSVSGPVTIDLSVSNVHRVEATGDVSISFANVSSSPAGNSVIIYVTDADGSGPHTLSWPSSVLWDGGNAVTDVDANGNVEVSLMTDDGGTEWRGHFSGRNFA